MDIFMLILPLSIFLLSEFFCVKMILPRLNSKLDYHYFDRTTWLWILIITNIFGYLFYMYFEEQDKF